MKNIYIILILLFLAFPVFGFMIFSNQSGSSDTSQSSSSSESLVKPSSSSSSSKPSSQIAISKEESSIALSSSSQSKNMITNQDISAIYNEDIDLLVSSGELFKEYRFSRNEGISLTISTSKPFELDQGGYCAVSFERISEGVIKTELDFDSKKILRYAPENLSILSDNEDFETLTKKYDVNDASVCIKSIPKFEKEIGQQDTWVLAEIEKNCSNCSEDIKEYENIILSVIG